MATAKRTTTKAGMGEVRPSGVRRFGTRDTIPVLSPPPPPSESFTAEEAATGKRRRFTRDIALAFVDETPAASSEAPPSGERAKTPRAAREAIRIDRIEAPRRAKKTTLRGAVAYVPRIVNASRIARAPLDPRDAFVLSMIDGHLSLPELADATGMSETDVEAIVARLARVGIVTM